jgi:hypothetical protein
MLQVFYQGVAYVSHLCCKCFIQILHMSSTRVSVMFQMYMLQGFNYFKCMLQMFPLNVAKVDMVLHML